MKNIKNILGSNKMTSIKKIFITGGAGFIGSHVVDTLLKDGYQVTVFDNLSTGEKAWIEKHLDNNNFKFIQGDILNLDHLEKSIRGNDLVWHLAANTNIPKGFKIGRASCRERV